MKRAGARCGDCRSTCKVPRQTDAGTRRRLGAEGAALPVVSYGFDYLKFSPVRLGSLFVAADELLRAPQAEAVLLAMRRLARRGARSRRRS